MNAPEMISNLATIVQKNSGVAFPKLDNLGVNRPGVRRRGANHAGKHPTAAGQLCEPIPGIANHVSRPGDKRPGDG